MTIKVTITHDQPDHPQAIAVQYINARGELGMSGPNVLQAGETGVFYVHSGQQLKVYEV